LRIGQLLISLSASLQSLSQGKSERVPESDAILEKSVLSESHHTVSSTQDVFHVTPIFFTWYHFKSILSVGY